MNEVKYYNKDIYKMDYTLSDTKISFPVFKKTLFGTECLIIFGTNNSNSSAIYLITGNQELWQGTKDVNVTQIGILTNGIPEFYKDINKEYIDSLLRIEEEEEENELITDTWVAEWLNDDPNDWKTVENEGDGDCLFASIRDAYLTIGINKSVEELREIVADSADDETLKQYLYIYNSMRGDFEEMTNNLNQLKDKYNELNNAFIVLQQNNVPEEDLKIKKEEAKKIKKEYLSVKNELDKLKKEDNIHNEFKFLENVKTLNDLKSVMKTKYYYADTYAISSLERWLKIKLVVLSMEVFIGGREGNIIQCGERILENPEQFIIVSYTGNHYTLVIYKGIGLFNKKNIPSVLAIELKKQCGIVIKNKKSTKKT